jgi:cytochrome c biogenesis protein CcdA/glutaredoxin
MKSKKLNQIFKLFLVFVFFLTLFGTKITYSQEDSYNDDLCIHIFTDEKCDECTYIKSYINSLNLTDINLIYHSINDEEGKDLYNSFKEVYGLTSAGFPILFVEDKYFIGMDIIEKNLLNIIAECKKDPCPCPAGKIDGFTPEMPKKKDYKSEKTETMFIPILGEIEIGSMPLFLMTALIAFVDGFNPCSLWVLTFLLGIIIYSGSRKKIFSVGLTFLIVTAFAYGLFMLGLLNVFSYVGYTLWIKILVATIALIFALVNIKDYFWYKKGISFTISDKHKPSLFKKIRNIMNPRNSLFSMLLATVLMALGVVLVELPCTAGFPMIWTNLLSSHEISNMTFIFLFLIYILIYLIDELIVFVGATITLKASKFEEKHGRILKLVGGMIMLALAIAMLFFYEIMNTVMGSIYVFGFAILISFLIMYLHRKVLPKHDIYIGTEFEEHKPNFSEGKKQKLDKKKKNFKLMKHK